MVKKTLKQVVEKTNQGISERASKIGFNECRNKIIKLIDKMPQLAILDKTYPKVIDAEELIKEIKKLNPEFAQS